MGYFLPERRDLGLVPLRKVGLGELAPRMKTAVREEGKQVDQMKLAVQAVLEELAARKKSVAQELAPELADCWLDLGHKCSLCLENREDN